MPCWDAMQAAICANTCCYPYGDCDDGAPHSESSITPTFKDGIAAALASEAGVSTSDVVVRCSPTMLANHARHRTCLRTSVAMT